MQRSPAFPCLSHIMLDCTSSLALYGEPSAYLIAFLWPFSRCLTSFRRFLNNKKANGYTSAALSLLPSFFPSFLPSFLILFGAVETVCGRVGDMSVRSPVLNHCWMVNCTWPWFWPWVTQQNIHFRLWSFQVEQNPGLLSLEINHFLQHTHVGEKICKTCWTQKWEILSQGLPLPAIL